MSGLAGGVIRAFVTSVRDTATKPGRGKGKSSSRLSGAAVEGGAGMGGVAAFV